MSSISHNLSFYKPITKDGLILKKLVSKGFGPCPGKGMECVVNYYSETEDGRFLDNTNVLREPYVFTLGKMSVNPGLEIAIRSMEMGEKAVFCIAPEYSFLSEEKFKKCDEALLSSLKNESFKVEVDKHYSKEELLKMEPKDAKKYQNVYYEIELVKFDKPRPKRVTLSPNERMEQASELKKEGNELFMQKRYREAIIKYKDGHYYLTQIPTQCLSEGVRDIQNSLTLNITNCHIKLLEYNYALKNLDEYFHFPKTPKVFYYKAVCHMRLGEFDVALENLEELKKVMPDDPSVKQCFDEFYALKEKTIGKQKENYKKGLFESGLYSEKANVVEGQFDIPKFNSKNKCVYIDYLVNGDEMNPQKIKIEIVNKIPEVIKYIEDSITKKTLVKRGISFDFDNEANNTLTIEEAFPSIANIDNYNIYSPNEETLLLLQGNKLQINIDKISTKIEKDTIVVGRVYYNNKSLIQLKKEKKKGKIEITDIDYTLNY